MSIKIKKGSSILTEEKEGIVEGGFLQFLLPILAAAAGPVLSNILNKLVDFADDKIHGRALSIEINGHSIPLKKKLTKKDEEIITNELKKVLKNINIDEDDIPLVLRPIKNKNPNPTEKMKQLLGITE
ncbi:hypothetical protein AHEVV2_004 [Adoxophyes honmai entomopoxvirus 'L' virophage 2]|nr:hypothetical protein AHEVV2_004 [Adoxophyes honmai entomopoxvirus 'L' virophage 2]